MRALTISLFKTDGSKASVGQRVEEYVKSALYMGHLAPRERIIEGDIARRLGVSRGPVREALLRLETEGLITITQRRGTFVRDFSASEIAVIFKMRAKLEALAVRLMRERLTPQHQAALRSCVRKMKSAAVHEDDDKFFYADMDFHRTIWKLSGAPQLFRTLCRVMNPFIFAIARSYSSRVPIRERYANHRAYHEMILKTPLRRVEVSVERYYDNLYKLTFQRTISDMYAPRERDSHEKVALPHHWNSFTHTEASLDVLQRE